MLPWSHRLSPNRRCLIATPSRHLEISDQFLRHAQVEFESGVREGLRAENELIYDLWEASQGLAPAK